MLKALTVCQPYAHLIVHADPRTTAPRKLVENRSWETKYRGPLVIHAGKSRQWLSSYEPMDEGELDGMVFGAVVGLGQLADCIAIEDIHNYEEHTGRTDLLMHEHTEGPWCWILTQMLRLVCPIPLNGAQGLWNLHEDIIRGADFVEVSENIPYIQGGD